MHVCGYSYNYLNDEFKVNKCHHPFYIQMVDEILSVVTTGDVVMNFTALCSCFLKKDGPVEQCCYCYYH